MVGEGFEVEDLSSRLLEVVKETGFSSTCESGEDVEVGQGIGKTFGEVLQDEFAVALVAALKNAGTPSDGAQDVGEGAGAESAAPAVEKGVVLAVPDFL